MSSRPFLLNETCHKEGEITYAQSQAPNLYPLRSTVAYGRLAILSLLVSTVLRLTGLCRLCSVLFTTTVLTDEVLKVLNY